MKKDFYDKPIYTLTNYLISFLQASIYFALSNIALIIYFILSVLNPNVFNLLPLFIVLIPTGPALGALYSMAGKSLREKDMFFASQYFKYYKINFKSNLKIWLCFISISSILFVDFQYFYIHKTSSVMYVLFIILTALLGVITLYAFPINSRFNITIKDLFLTCLYYMIKKLPITILKGAAMFLTYYLVKNVSIIFLLFVPVPLCFALMYYDNIILSELEMRSVSNSHT